MKNLFDQEQWARRGENDARLATLATDLDTAEAELALINSGAWAPWTPTLTNMTLGNGTVVARYVKVGRLVVAKFEFTLGSTSAMGTGPQFTLPVACASTSFYIGTCWMTNVSSFVNTGFAQAASSGTAAVLRVSTAGGAYVGFETITATIPFTWASTHILEAILIYEALS